jgi:glycosyltransferase involved in cell wall biosynthesis
VISILLWISFPSVVSFIINDVEVTWYAPFFSGGGYCTEAVAVMLSMDSVKDRNFRFYISHHGDSLNKKYLSGLTQFEEEKLKLYSSKESKSGPLSTDSVSVTISVCHSEPGAWHAPYPNYHTITCPPRKSGWYKKYQTNQETLSWEYQYNIGRTMFETDRLPSGWDKRLNYMDEVWVPTEQARVVFETAGVVPAKLQVVGEAVDTTFYAPQNLSDLKHFNNPSNEKLTEIRKTPQSDMETVTMGGISAFTSISDRSTGFSGKDDALVPDLLEQLRLTTLQYPENNTTVFLFVGKVEIRKGLPILLEAYFNAFTCESATELWIVSGIDSDGVLDMLNEVYPSASILQSKMTCLAKFAVFQQVPQRAMPYLYSRANALVRT